VQQTVKGKGNCVLKIADRRATTAFARIGLEPRTSTNLGMAGVLASTWDSNGKHWHMPIGKVLTHKFLH